MIEKSDPKIVYDKDNHCASCEGSWSIMALDKLDNQLPDDLIKKDKLIFSGKKLAHFDSSGALALLSISKQYKKNGYSVEFSDLTEQQQSLLDLLEEKKEVISYRPEPPKKDNFLASVGKETIHKLNQADGFIILVGDLSSKIFEAFGYFRRFRLPSIISIIDSAGIQALPIVALLSFLIGVVLAYQMGLQLQTYGANIFIAYLSGMAIFREFAPLITAIIVAGRTSSSFTAQIGSMKINEEVDALLTMGLSPTELLVMPKVMGLLLVFPLLIFWADFFSVLGAMFMSKWMLNVGYHDFLTRLRDTVGLKQLMLGLYKAPMFALIIALVGCYQGLLVEANAESIGTQTTRSVVQALFLIIVADAMYSIIYSWMGL